jgi:hypothetical protein
MPPKTHGITLQAVVTPFGIFACIFGAHLQKSTCLHMLTETGLLQTLQNFMPTGNEHGGDDDGIYSFLW